MKLVSKGYKIDFNKIEEGYLFSEYTTNADNISKAKSELLKRIKYEDCKVILTSAVVTYLNIPVVRSKEHDLYEYNGKSMTLLHINAVKNEENRIVKLNAILSNDDIKYCYIQKRGSYYRPNSCGYTGMVHLAGVYAKKEAVSDAMSCNEIYITPIDIKVHNKMINEMINELQSRILS